MACRSVRACFALGIVLVSGTRMAGRAAAHTAPPAVTQIMANAPGDIVVATTRGLAFGDPATHKWSLLCGDTFGVPAASPYRAAQLPTGRLVVGDLTGLRSSDDHGCSWHPHPTLGKLQVTALAQPPEHPERMYVASFGNGSGGIRVSEDGGNTYRMLQTATDDEYISSLLAAGANPTHIYAVLATTDQNPKYFVLHSSDGGTTWDRQQLKVATGPPECVNEFEHRVNRSSMSRRPGFGSRC